MKNLAIALLLAVFAFAQSKTGGISKIGGTARIAGGGGAGGPVLPACTLFASPSGPDTNSGLDVAHPKTLQGAANATVPGSVVCLEAGTYNRSSPFVPPQSGTAAQWIVYRAYGDGQVNFVWTGTYDASPMIQLGTSSTVFPNGPSYLEFRGLNFDGNAYYAADGIYCRGGHHINLIGNHFSHLGSAGYGDKRCDYTNLIGNTVWDSGYVPVGTPVPQYYGWSSGISLNSHQWYDTYSGFHSIVANNIISGEYDRSTHHTDGNGIILDLSNGTYTPSTANTPPALIINNVIYGNGGDCIQPFIVTNYYVVNNACFKNNLDTSLGITGSVVTHSAHDGYYINNIAYSYDPAYYTYGREGTLISNDYHYYNLYWNAGLSNLPQQAADHWINADPLFLSPPVLAVGGYVRAPDPQTIGNSFTLQAGSAARGYGIDATTVAGLPPQIVADMAPWFYTAINGTARAHGGACDLGAYQQ